MDRPRRVDLIVEDVAHERFATALVHRLSRDAGVTARPRSVSARGGHARVVNEVRALQTSLYLQSGTPDLLVVLVDANSVGPKARRDELDKVVDRETFPHVVIGCPDPHIERWYLADPVSLRSRFDLDVDTPGPSFVRGFYKNRLRNALVAAGHPVTLGGAEYADEIVDAMDLFAAGKNDSELRKFVEALRLSFKRWK